MWKGRSWMSGVKGCTWGSTFLREFTLWMVAWWGVNCTWLRLWTSWDGLELEYFLLVIVMV